MQVFPCFLKKRTSRVDRGLAPFQLNYANSIKRGRFPQQVAEERLSGSRPRLPTTISQAWTWLSRLCSKAWALKKEIFKELDSRM